MHRRVASEQPRNSRTFGQRKVSCFLLAGGFRLSDLRCCCCGRDFDEPRKHGEKFRVVLPVVDPGILSPRLVSGARIFVGSKVMVAAVNRRLDQLVDSSTAFIGEKVLVALPMLPQGIRVPYVFCRGCGSNVIDKATRVGEPYYRWDWLADLKPRWLASWRR